MNNKKQVEIPAVSDLEAMLKQEKKDRRFRALVRSTLYALITVAAVAVLVATLWMPVLKVYGGSMTPTLVNGDIVVSVKTTKFEQGDVIAFYYNNNILVKRVIADDADWVNIDQSGNVFVNGTQIDEPYIQEKALGYCDITLPYQVPDSRIFVMGDHRDTSIDSRSTSVGCVADEYIVGKLVFCVWPLNHFGFIE